MVIAIIGVLVRPALTRRQAARGAARRIQCANNLKQIGLAAHGYVDSVEVLPFGQGPEPTNTWNGWSSLGMLLPYLEQRSVYASLNFDIPDGSAPGAVANTTGQQIRIGTFLCPSDTDRLTGVEGHTNYTGCTGSKPNMNDGITIGVFGGMFGPGQHVSTTVGIADHHRWDEPDGRLQRTRDGDRALQRWPRAGPTHAARLGPADRQSTDRRRRGLSILLCHRSSRRLGRFMAGLYSIGLILVHWNSLRYALQPCDAAEYVEAQRLLTRRGPTPPAADTLVASTPCPPMGRFGPIRTVSNLDVWRALGTKSGSGE